MKPPKTITRAHLTKNIVTKTSLSQKQAAELIEGVFKEISQALAQGESVKLPAFGTFTVRRKKERVGRNPKTKQEVTIAPRTVVSFKVSPLLKEKLNKNG